MKFYIWKFKYCIQTDIKLPLTDEIEHMQQACTIDILAIPVSSGATAERIAFQQWSEWIYVYIIINLHIA